MVNALRWTPHPFGADLRDALVPEEVNRIDLFQQVAFDLNVVLESDTPPPAQTPEG